MTETFFQTSNHRERFTEVMHRIGKVYDGTFDPEYSAALYILTYGLGLWSKVQRYVDSEGIGFEEMLHEVDLSGGQSVLVLLAANLFNNTQHVDPLEFLRLDSGNFHVALNAIKIRRDGLQLSDVQGVSAIKKNPYQLSEVLLKAAADQKNEKDLEYWHTSPNEDAREWREESGIYEKTDPAL